jgi:hypothetical protein
MLRATTQTTVTGVEVTKNRRACGRVHTACDPELVNRRSYELKVFPGTLGSPGLLGQAGSQQLEVLLTIVLARGGHIGELAVLLGHGLVRVVVGEEAPADFIPFG